MKIVSLALLSFAFAIRAMAAEPDSVLDYTKRITDVGIVIKAPAGVKPKALSKAKEIVEAMLKNRPDVARRLAEKKAELAIIPRESYITALPEFARLSKQKDPNGNAYDSFAVRGAGAIPVQPVTATSEENLLKLKDDRFSQESITHHEFAHAIMNLGFSDMERNRWHEIYQAAAKRNIFPGAFAMKNADEYWAELSQSYFSVNNEINGDERIRKEDRVAFEFLRSVYDPPKSPPQK